MTKFALHATTIGLALLGCGRGDSPPDEPSTRPPEAAAPSPPAADDPVARWAALLPDSLRHRGNACPFECCVYRDWTPTGEVALRPRPSHTEAAGTVIPANQTFTADSGFVRVTGISLVEVTDTVVAEPGVAATFLPGDTLVVLDYVGEGHFNVWDGERVREVGGFWGAEVWPSSGILIGGERYAREWWVHATTRAGDKGWFNADSVARLRGADACGAP
jgi:hypothetical protein